VSLFSPLQRGDYAHQLLLFCSTRYGHQPLTWWRHEVFLFLAVLRMRDHHKVNSHRAGLMCRWSVCADSDTGHLASEPLNRRTLLTLYLKPNPLLQLFKQQVFFM
jgi:hypothetical protein